jgi:protein-S-isoprenylcysteine O-methyltransferase Ste14
MKTQIPDPTAPDADAEIKWSQLWLRRAKLILVLGLLLVVVGELSDEGMSLISNIGIILTVLGGVGAYLLWRSVKAEVIQRDMDNLRLLMKKNSRLEKRNRELEARASEQSPLS